MKQIGIGLVVLLSMVAVVPTPAAANHDFCPNNHFFGGSVSGTVTNANPSDFWAHDQLSLTSINHDYVLQPSGGDADLYVWNSSCSSVICSSAAGGTTTDKCRVSILSGLTVFVEVRLFSTGSTVGYTLTEVHVPLI